MASSVEMLSGRKKKDYEAEAAADALAAQAAAMGEAPATEPIPADHTIEGFTVDEPSGEDEEAA